ncbi:MAG: helix-turn-helix domain-containing protein [Candidatus Glassbacteria bacterium]|nr:helix-turn-helix domain-containing protein [Candidatus Glassbacteria bacterium]
MKSSIVPQTLSDRETAFYIGMSSSWLRQSRVTGNPDAPPFIKIGRSVRYLREDLEAWLRSKRRTSTVHAANPDTQNSH